MSWFTVSREGCPEPWRKTDTSAGTVREDTLLAAREAAREDGNHHVVRLHQNGGAQIIATAEACTGEIIRPRGPSPVVPQAELDQRAADYREERAEPKLPAGYTVKSERVTWMRDDDQGRPRISHPRQAILTDQAGDVHHFDTQREAKRWAEGEELAAYAADHGLAFEETWPEKSGGKLRYRVGDEVVTPTEARARFMPERAQRWQEANAQAAELDAHPDHEAGC